MGPRPPTVGVGSGRSGNEWGSLGSNGAGGVELLPFAGELCEPILSRYGGGGGGVIDSEMGWRRGTRQMTAPPSDRAYKRSNWQESDVLGKARKVP